MTNLLSYRVCVRITPLTWHLVPNLVIYHPNKKVVQGRGFRYEEDKSVVSGFDFYFLFLSIDMFKPDNA